MNTVNSIGPGEFNVREYVMHRAMKRKHRRDRENARRHRALRAIADGAPNASHLAREALR